MYTGSGVTAGKAKCGGLACSSPTETGRELCVHGPLSPGRSNKAGENSFKLLQGRFRLDIMKNFYTEKFVKPWKKLPREMVESLSLEVLKRHVDVLLMDMV